MSLTWDTYGTCLNGCKISVFTKLIWFLKTQTCKSERNKETLTICKEVKKNHCINISQIREMSKLSIGCVADPDPPGSETFFLSGSGFGSVIIGQVWSRSGSEINWPVGPWSGSQIIIEDQASWTKKCNDKKTILNLKSSIFSTKLNFLEKDLDPKRSVK